VVVAIDCDARWLVLARLRAQQLQFQSVVYYLSTGTAEDVGHAQHGQTAVVANAARLVVAQSASFRSAGDVDCPCNITPGTPLFRRIHPKGGIGGRITPSPTLGARSWASG